jgi:hypothetical protein
MRMKIFWGSTHEIFNRETLNRHWWSQDQREPRRTILERPEGIAHAQAVTPSKLVATIDGARQHGNLSSAIRLFVLNQVRNPSLAGASG